MEVDSMQVFLLNNPGNQIFLLDNPGNQSSKHSPKMYSIRSKNIISQKQKYRRVSKRRVKTPEKIGSNPEEDDPQNTACQ